MCASRKFESGKECVWGSVDQYLRPVLLGRNERASSKLPQKTRGGPASYNKTSVCLSDFSLHADAGGSSVVQN